MPTNPKRSREKCIPRSSSSRSRKVKTGCRTCKARKVKCDEGRPACSRCVSTGRVCDGYGIWGGGGNGYHERSPCLMELPNKLPLSISPLGSISTEELGHLEYFISRSTKKLPGPFESTFWGKLVLQACLDEPSILHAVLALSATHRDEYNESLETVPNKQEMFALRHYSKAINCLRPHFVSKSKSSIRIALIACLVFICLEYLRGHFRTGFAHLENGLKLLIEAQSNTNTMYNGCLILMPAPEIVDTCIFESFAGLHLQIALLGERSDSLNIILHTTDFDSEISTFESVSDARLSLNKLLHGMLLFYDRRRKEIASDLNPNTNTIRWLGPYRRVLQLLIRWREAYDRTISKLEAPTFIREILGYKLVKLYYNMGCIITYTSLWPEGESRYDAHAAEFTSIVTEALEIAALVASPDLPDINLLHDPGMARSTAETGWIPPLFFVAIKCRLPNIRRAAVKLLRSSVHKEGIWDSSIAAAIAEELIRVEEQGAYDGSILDNPAAGASLEGFDRSLPPLPEQNRLPDVQIILPDTSSEKVGLVYKQRHANGTWGQFKSEFDPVTQCWKQT